MIDWYKSRFRLAGNERTHIQHCEFACCLIDFNYTRDTNTAKFEAAKFDSYFRHFGEGVIFVFRQTKSKFAHGEWRSLSANPEYGTARIHYAGSKPPLSMTLRNTCIVTSVR